ncbi:hypothetical protein HUU62_08920 [Rhodoferax sp. 4810]|uniref:Type IV pilus assembly protein PilX n=1 Tax=Thiospirillum jenense TaxID=1653858 RepID=A0A839HH01_9GAMM|nr:PilX N-terminal domain-containing pilus assembly protein [Thiospirillum jenense]MBB1074532.1 hypothetical protein [Rhodoferax jenense]MBB1126506.1 hypothetical protein [Thiospirillum jenense]
MSYPNQQGAVLITGLMILLIATIIGVSAVQNTAFDERMANNSRGEQLAFQAAEAAIREAARTIESNKSSLTIINSPTTPRPDFNQDCATWTSTNQASNVNMIGEHAVLASLPVYTIEELEAILPVPPDQKFCNGVEMNPTPLLHPYRITACAQGSLNTAVVVLEALVCAP